MKKAPTPGFLLAHPAHFVALGFGAGLSPVAPGTVGTLVALPLAALLHATAGDAGYLIAVGFTFAIGVWAADRTGRALGAADHGAIVWDEVVAFLLVLFFVGTDPVRQAIAFLLFRLFDIVKPPPANLIDREWHNGFGVMADDIVAAFYTVVVIALWQRVSA
ncbi:MAG: phosphatidylglycerophosphatase A [Pseudomonadota bacterium]|nr:phosphatidylglycerophosphatase A [Pseudomonadota bacterium]